ncbi:DUF1405 domain-containing protein [Halobaculum sp. MBLA0147]|uniref:DUF1405 domain-containing protein n=1 Tax=Halobaculum sp. MBLA0147 TaxID=3079934 RepID=UPI0035233698
MSRDDPRWNPLPARVASFYLSTPWTLSLLLVGNGLAFLVGVRYYLDTMGAVPTFLWPLYGDSPTALALGTLVLATALPALSGDFWGTDVESEEETHAGTDEETNDPSSGSRATARHVPGPLAVVTTLAVVWLVETGLWTAVALNVPFVRPDLPFDLYVGFDDDSLWAYWGILATHVAFLVEAALIARLGRTSRRLLAGAFLAVLCNDLFDYGFLVGLPTAGHPPVRYEPTWVLAAGSVATSVVAVVVAGWLLPRGTVARD